MFLNTIKDFFVKYKLKVSLKNIKLSFSTTKIRLVGIIIDENNFDETASLIKKLQNYGFEVTVLTFKDIINKNTTTNNASFSYADVAFFGTIKSEAVNSFINSNFDMLLNYYDQNKMPLLTVSAQSKANFKVGFASVNHKINHFMIATSLNNYELYTNELLKYLKILNKI